MLGYVLGETPLEWYSVEEKVLLVILLGVCVRYC